MGVSVNPTEIYALHVELLGVLDSMFEIWLGLTFAVLVAIHLAARQLGRFVLTIGVLLYLTASYLFALRFLHTSNVFQIQEFH